LRINHNKDYSSTQFTANRKVSNSINDVPSYSVGSNNTNSNNGKDNDKDDKDMGDYSQGNKNNSNLNQGVKKEESKNVKNLFDNPNNKISTSTSTNDNKKSKC